LTPVGTATGEAVASATARAEGAPATAEYSIREWSPSVLQRKPSQLESCILSSECRNAWTNIKVTNFHSIPTSSIPVASTHSRTFFPVAKNGGLKREHAAAIAAADTAAVAEASAAIATDAAGFVAAYSKPRGHAIAAAIV